MGVHENYIRALQNMPAPGGGGCHTALLGACNLGVMAGRTDAELLAEIRGAIPPGRRRVPDREIRDAIRRARQDVTPWSLGDRRPIPPPRRTPTEAERRAAALIDEATARAIRERALASTAPLDPFSADIWEASPVKIEPRSEAFPFAGDMVTLLQALYRPEDVLFIGKREISAKPGRDIRTSAEWIDFFQSALEWIENQPEPRRQAELARLGEQYPLIVPNPLTGREGAKKDGGTSFRADACIADFRFIVAEFDDLPFEQQGAMLHHICTQGGAKLAALIYSGGKSCHSWIICDGVKTVEEWQSQVKDGLFPVLAALGVDKACSNPSRLSRLPGVFRPDKNKWQKLLYLAPEGGTL